MLATALAGLAVIQAALAERYPVRYSVADQAAARAAVLKKSDLGAATGWEGGATKPDLSDHACGGYEAKRSDLLLTGAAASTWRLWGALTRFWVSRS